MLRRYGYEWARRALGAVSGFVPELHSRNFVTFECDVLKEEHSGMSGYLREISNVTVVLYTGRAPGDTSYKLCASDYVTRFGSVQGSGLPFVRGVPCCAQLSKFGFM